jgi:hypothetical protein
MRLNSDKLQVSTILTVTWVLCIAGSSNVYFDLDASSNQSSG